MNPGRLRLLVCAGLLSAANRFAQTNPAFVPASRQTLALWRSQHEEFVSEAKKGRVDILFLGDSITDFWRNRGADVWAKYYAPRQAANFGISADRTQHVLWRVEHGELDGIKPKVVVLLIGTNNSKTDPAEDIAKAIKGIIDDIHAKISGTKVLLLGIFPRGPHRNPDGTVDDGSQCMATIRAVNEIIAKYDDGGKTVKFLDIGPRFLGADGKVRSDIMPDHLHPNEKGYQIWADAMEPTLDEMLK
jgi:lysophospholipase L1-like esterase